VAGVVEQGAQQPGADALVPVRGQDERVGQVAPAAGIAAGLRHPLEDGQVDHADQRAGLIGHPGGHGRSAYRSCPGA
jgi:hypothetical protein